MSQCCCERFAFLVSKLPDKAIHSHQHLVPRYAISKAINQNEPLTPTQRLENGWYSSSYRAKGLWLVSLSNHRFIALMVWQPPKEVVMKLCWMSGSLLTRIQRNFSAMGLKRPHTSKGFFRFLSKYETAVRFCLSFPNTVFASNPKSRIKSLANV